MAEVEKPPIVGEPRRNERRARVLLSGKIAYRAGEVSYDVSITNLSTTGARIRFPFGAALPKRVQLIVIRTQTAYDAEVTWLKPPFAGLKLTRSYALGGVLPDECAHLKALWIACSAR